jgi:ABC-type molybdenum transport system ATPase subunit/photorepair protein PhrA
MSSLEKLILVPHETPVKIATATEPTVADGRGGWIKLPARIRLGPRTIELSKQLVVLRGERRLKPGTITFLEGLSGSGKSRLLREIIDTLHHQLSIGLVPQEPSRCFPDEMTVYEAIDGGPARLDANKVGTWFPRFESALWGRRFYSLSEGQRQRLLLAREGLRLDAPSDSKRPRLFLLDEPFGSVDPVSHVAMLERIVAWIASRPTEAMALIVSHSPDADAMIARDVEVQRWRLEVT